MGVMGIPPMLSLSATSDSFPFQSKCIQLIGSTKVVLGSEAINSQAENRRIASATNGWFPPRSSLSGKTPVSPLPLSSCHAEVWTSGGHVSPPANSVVV